MLPEYKTHKLLIQISSGASLGSFTHLSTKGLMGYICQDYSGVEKNPFLKHVGPGHKGWWGSKNPQKSTFIYSVEYEANTYTG